MTYTPSQRFTDLAALLDAAVGLTELEFDEHSRTARQARRLESLLARVADARTAALHAAALNRRSRRLERRINRTRDRLGDFATDLEVDSMERERR
jgi:hypothetical protein